MKLSELSSDKAMDVLCDAAVYIGNITSDTELMTTLKNCAMNEKLNTTAEKMAWFADKFSALLPVVLKKHKADVFGIVAAVNGMTAAAVAKQNFLETMKQVRDMVKDKELVDFFKSCAKPEVTE